MDKSAAEHHNPSQTGLRHKNVEYLPALFLVIALVFLPTGPESDSLNVLALVFVSIVLEAIPFMLVGALVGGFIEAFVSQDRLATMLPGKGWLTVCLAAGAGMVFPVCECAVVPVVRRLVGKGLPLSAAIAYLLGGPIVNPIVAGSTAIAYAYDWRVVIMRLGLGYGLAVAIGLCMGRLFSNAEAIRDNGAASNGDTPAHACLRQPLEGPHGAGGGRTSQHFPVIMPQADTIACGCGGHHPPFDDRVTRAGAAFVHAMDDFLAVGHYLVIGAFIAALAQTYIDRSLFLSITGTSVLSVVLMMVLAILLNLCSEADAFIAASFQGLMSLPAQMAFLLTGPMFDLKLLLMYQSVFRRKTIVVLASLICTGVFVIVMGLEFSRRLFW